MWIESKRRALASFIILSFLSLCWGGGIVHSESLPSNDREDLKQMEDLYNSGLYPRLTEHVFEALKRWPRSYLTSDFLFLLAASTLQNGNPTQAGIILKGTHMIYPSLADNPQHQLLQSLIAEKEGQLEKALSLLNRVNTDVAVYRSALLLRDLGQGYAAVSKLLGLPTRFPESPLKDVAQLALADCYVSLEQFQNAENLLKSLEPKGEEFNAVKSYLEASLAYRKGDFSRALQITDMLRGLDKPAALKPYVFLLMGRAAAELGKYPLAVEAYSKNMNTSDATCLKQSMLGLTAVCIQMNDPDRATFELNKVLTRPLASTEKATALLLRGVASERAGKNSSAVQDFEEVVRMDEPNLSDKSLVLWGSVWLKENAYSRLVTDYTLAYRQYESKTKKDASLQENDLDLMIIARLIIAEAQYSLCRYTMAEDLYKEILQGSPSPGLYQVAVSGLVASLVYQGRIKDARQKTEELLVRFGEDRSTVRYCLLNQGHLFWREELYEDARKQYQKYAEMFPNDEKAPLAVYQWGASYEKLGQGKETLVVWDDLRKRYPQSPYAFRALVRSADLANKMGLSALATATYQELSKMAPGAQSERARFELAKLKVQNHKYKEALLEFDEFLGAYPESPLAARAMEGISVCYGQIAVLDPEVLPGLVAQCTKSDHAGEGYYQMGLRSFDKARYIDAIQDFEAVINRYPKTPSYPKALFYKGESEYRAGHYKDALVTFAHLLEIYPDHDLAPLARLHRGQSLLQMGYADEAILVFRDVMERHPQSGYAAAAGLNLAAVYRQDNNIDQEISTYEDFIRSFPGHPKINEVCYRLGSAMKKKGAYQAALGYWMKVQPEPAVVSKEDLHRSISELEKIVNMRGVLQ